MAAFTAVATAATKAGLSALVAGGNKLAVLEATEYTPGEEDVETVSEAIEDATNRSVERLLFVWRLELDVSIMKARRTMRRYSNNSVTQLAKRTTKRMKLANGCEPATACIGHEVPLRTAWAAPKLHRPRDRWLALIPG